MTDRKPKTENRKPKIMVVAGEASGDQHAARLVAALRDKLPQAQFFGIGGKSLAAQGVKILWPAEELAVVGLLEVAEKIPKIWQAFLRLWRALQTQRPQLAILVDFPDFNFWVARLARYFRVPVMYYISPQIWAWRRYRVRTIARLVDRMVVIFPFEEEFYRRHGVAVTYVGHPLLENLPQLPSRRLLRQQLAIQEDELAIALLPGSRPSEIKQLLPTLLAGAGLVQQQLPRCRFLLPLASSTLEGIVREITAPYPLKLQIVSNQTYEILSAVDLAVVTSGTATLETALWATPMVIVYRVAPLTYQVGRQLIRVKYIGMANLLAEEGLFPELIQDKLTPDSLAREIFKIIHNPQYLMQVKSGLARIINRLGGLGASRRAADVAVALINK
jgi:lipid-A-disaccharide synthase